MTVQMKIGSKTAYINGREYENDVAPIILNDRTMIPVRFISESFGACVMWDEKDESVTILNRKKYFDSIDDCAFDFGMYFNALSVAIFRETGAIIYEDKNNGYYWDNPKIGYEKSIVWTNHLVKEGVAFIHTHSGGEVSNTNAMSYSDKSYSEEVNRPYYMVDSGGNMYVYDKNKSKAQRFIKTGLPVDGKYIDIKESSDAMNKYFGGKYFGLAGEFEIGYIADFYNCMYLKGVNYTKYPYYRK